MNKMAVRASILLAGFVLQGCAQTTTEKTRAALDLHNRANELYAVKDCVAALSVYQEVVRRYPEGAEVWFRMGNCHARLRQRPAAVAAYRQALVLSPSYAKAWHNLVYVESQGLVETLGRMNDQLLADDPVRLQVAKLLERLLSAEAGKLGQPAGQGVQASRAAGYQAAAGR